MIKIMLGAIMVLSLTVSSATIQSYPLPSIYRASSIFSLKAENTDIPVISCEDQYDYAGFSFSGTVTIQVTVSGNITDYSISPMAKNIAATVTGNKLTFTLSTSTYVIVTINDLKKLVIAADPLETDIPASSGAGIHNVTSAPYNADKTGTSLATPAIQQAIDDAHNAGGGIVYVPAGVYKCKNLYLKSNVTLYLAGGSVIVGTGNGADYVTDFRKTSLSKDGTYFIRTTTGSRNITMRGRGTIDGNGTSMRFNSNFLNNLLVPMQTSNFTFDGITLRDGGFWAFMIVRSDNVLIENYKGFQTLDYLEADAIDINESQNVFVRHGIGISHDDAFSTKTWWQTGMSVDWPGTVEDNNTVTFDDCLAWSACVAFKIGQGVGQLQKSVSFINSYVYDCSRALAIDHSYGPASVQNVTFDNIDIERCFYKNFGNYWFTVRGSSPGPVHNVKFSNITVRSTGDWSLIRGSSDTGSVDGVLFSNINIKGTIAKSLTDLKATQGVFSSNVKIVDSMDILLIDNFETGNLSEWTASSGDWASTIDGSGALTQKNFTASIITRGSSWTDYAYEAGVKLPIADANAGLIFRVQDASNYYMYRLNGSEKMVELYKCVDGTLVKVSGAAFTFVPGEWNMLKIEVQGNNIKGYVNGRLKTDWSNPVTELTSGKIGFRTTSQNVSFDDVLVVDYLTDQATPVLKSMNTTSAAKIVSFAKNNGIVSMSLIGFKAGSYTIEFFTLNGKMIFRSEAAINGSSCSIPVPSHLSSGMYGIRINGNGENAVFRGLGGWRNSTSRISGPD